MRHTLMVGGVGLPATCDRWGIRCVTAEIMAGKAIDPLRIQNASKNVAKPRRQQNPQTTLDLAPEPTIGRAAVEPSRMRPPLPPPPPAWVMASPTELTIAEMALPSRSPSPRLVQILVAGAKSLVTPLVWISLLGFCGGTGVAAFLWLATLPPAPNCKTLSFWSGDSDRLICADQMAKTGDPTAIVQAIELVNKWSPNHPLQERVKPLLEEWSKALLNLAYQQVNQNDLSGAIALVKHIPASTTAHEYAQKGIQDWGKDLQKLHTIEPPFHKALKAQKWNDAIDKIQALSDLKTNYWKQQRNRMRQQVVNERMARDLLTQLHEMAAAGTAEALTATINQAAMLRTDTFTYQEASKDIQGWQQRLIQLAQDHLREGDSHAAMVLTHALPSQTQLPPDLYQLMWLEAAQQNLANSANSIDMPALAQQLWAHANAVGVLQTVMPEQPLHPATKDLLPKLRQQTEDLAQLTGAAAIAHIAHPIPLQGAIQMAQAIQPDRPQRITAQTLVAEWRQATVRSQNALILYAAQQLASKGRLSDLQTAIAQAQRIPLGQPLRQEAQAQIFDWQQQLQAQAKQ